MGWWSHTVLGGDPALDVIDCLQEVLSQHFGIEIELYPTHAIRHQDDYENLRQLLIHRPCEDITKKLKSYVEIDGEIMYPIVASVYMAIGVPVPREIMENAIDQARDDEWADNSEARKTYMNAFIDALKTHDGETPIFELTEGLFDKLFDKHGDGKPRWLTIKQYEEQQ
ncbi:hypothetical protein VPHD479_0159 [Vibrio phage D479]